MSKKIKIVLIGAGSAVFTKNLMGDLMCFDDINIGTISLVDINETKLKVMAQIVRKMAQQKGRDVVVEETMDRREVLAGADYVVNCISVGGPEIYQRDLEICDKYNVRMVVGDIVNPTGIFRLIREYPSIAGMVRDMEELCPNAYFFNYSNPMHAICLALSQISDIRVFGFCHSVQGTAEMIADYLQVDHDALTYWAAGINHMAWYLDLKVDGEDVYPRFKESVKTMEQKHAVSAREHDYNSISKGFSDAVRMEIMNKFGYFVSESPFHMSEYTPYFRKSEESIEKWKVSDRWWLRHELSNDDYFDELKNIVEKDLPVEFELTREYAPRIIRANATGIPFRANLNVMNTGLITSLPNDCCVEVPCYADSEGIHPCYVGKLPDGPAALNLNNIAEHRLMAKAVNEKKLEWIYQAIQVDPYAAAQCDLDQLRAMTAELLENNKEYVKDYT